MSTPDLDVWVPVIAMSLWLTLIGVSLGTCVEGALRDRAVNKADEACTEVCYPAQGFAGPVCACYCAGPDGVPVCHEPPTP